jgi:hypothetical protein
MKWFIVILWQNFCPKPKNPEMGGGTVLSGPRCFFKTLQTSKLSRNLRIA